jgi:hypothetical protein
MTPLHFIAAQHVDRLRRQPHVRAHRNTALGQQTNRFAQPCRALDLDHVRTGLHQHRTVGEGLFGGGVGHEGKVGEDHCTLIAAFDAGNVIGHFGSGDWQRTVVALQDHPQRVADQQHFDTRLAGSVGEGRVVAGEHGDLFTFLLQAQQGRNGDIWHEKVLIQAL